MKNIITTYFKPKQGILPIFISDFLDICDPVLSFDKFMEGIDLSKYLKNIPVHDTGRIRYNPVNMLKTVLFGFMSQGYISLRELEDNCKVNIRFMYLMDNKRPSYRTFGYFINEVLESSIEDIFNDINKAIVLIKSKNCKVGLSIKPNTKVDEIIDYLDKIDLLLVMSVEPGYGGQSYIDISDKLKHLRKLQNNYNFVIEVDGGINDTNIKSIDTDVAVVGSFITSADNYQEQINKLKY